jgi:hypothetical protein
MLNHVWSVICRRSIVDNQSNNISLTDCLEQIRVNRPNGPDGKSRVDKFIIPIDFETVHLFSRLDTGKEGSFELKTDILAPGEIEIGTNTQNITFPAGPKRIRQITRTNGLPVSVSGIYWFVISIKETGENKFRSVAKLPLQVLIDTPDAN